ncbi:MAG: hypothetical protein HYT15_03925 [Candidatus Magasanikbacteria bacterium]|nr:hypothetical protein [Candidatus Magasanikbacteria bacterium]
MNNKIITTAIVALLIGAGITYVAVKPSYTGLPVKMSLQSFADNPQLSMPVINAYYNGQEIWFIHTEVSDAQMAQRLSSMVGGNNTMGMMATIHVPRLASVPKETAGKLYVFTNGVTQEGAKPWGGGPFGYQIDVFDSIPGQDGYTPLRNPYIVAWNESATPRILKSVDEILTAERNGEITVTQSDVIVNAPVVQWQNNIQGTQSNQMMNP